MRRFSVPRPSAALVVAIVALVMSLGGSAIAAKAVITGKDVKNGSLTGKDVKNGSLTGAKVKSGSLTGKQVHRGSLTGTQVKGDSLGGAQIDEGSLGQVPSAANAGHAGSADHAASADQLGGLPPSAYRSDWALIKGSSGGASILAQSGGISVTRVFAGVYSVNLGRSAVGRPISVTFNAGGAPGLGAAAPCGGSSGNPGGVSCAGTDDHNHVLVQTWAVASDGVDGADRTFYLVVGP